MPGFTITRGLGGNAGNLITQGFASSAVALLIGGTKRFVKKAYKELEEKGVLLPVRSYSIKYLLPAKYDDLLHIETKITKLEGVRIEFSYKISSDLGDLIATAETALVFVDSVSMKPIAMPKEFRSIKETVN